MWFKGYELFHEQPQPAEMLSKPLSSKKGCYTCQWLDNVDMHCMQNVIKICHVVHEL